ncbi:Catechol 2,3-dioxygenase [Gemmobacter megaterium]|uniref:Catechol 2,3-dioxygenase n=1 Tax=Gemmobacter megaterium TaxID=1086013 RepID=A0A1N7NXP4_9RHOB|nr:FosX/FosE/FosI family fosfomycin resistance hydrolase [Gemmobacter megaterium]GGE15976.1 FosX/FosE/FosI family fosfomycin resistance thiol transferase [Gemmobacter megaterium]SIT03092.1 Catechol 2,3-dioxygenase [Gemmobacter megaterium]
MSSGLSHVTFVVADLDRMQRVLEQVFGARCVYDSGDDTFSLSAERFFLIGETWVAIMQGDPLPSRSYNHAAFKVDDADIEGCRARILDLGLEIRPERPRVAGEGRSIYFYGPDNHLFEVHSGTLQDRLARYAQGKETAQ